MRFFDSLTLLGAALAQFLPGCGRTIGGRLITFGSYADPAQDVLKDVFLPGSRKTVSKPNG
jgi:hypothetical protein